MEYISVKEASALWGIDTSNIGKLCRKGKIEGAKIVGRSWLIPKNAPRPVDGRTKAAKEGKNAPDFRFPLYVNFPEDSFVPPLSPEEAKLRRAQADFYACEFQKAKAGFEALAEAAENIYVKICARFYMCALSAVYDTNISWEKYYCGLNLLLSADFPRKTEMELLLARLDFIIGSFGRIPERLNTGAAYEFHPTAWYMNAFLSVFNYDRKNPEAANTKSNEPFGTLCRIMERDGYCVEAQALNMTLFFHYFGAHDEEATAYHLRRGVKLAYEHKLYFAVADAEAYYTDAVNAALCDYPESFGELIRRNSRKIYDNFSGFAKKASVSGVYEKLSKSDYRYVFYAVEGYTNRQVASLCGVSERTAAKRYTDIYDKLDISSKQELIEKMNIAFGKR